MSSENKSDPRVYFAAERTFLAWVRSGITLMALGFVVAKFGLLMDLLTAPQQTQPPSLEALLTTQGTNYLGVAILLVGAIIIILAQWNHQQFIQSLPKHDIPDLPIKWLGMLLTYTMSLAAVAICFYLVFI